MKHNYNYFAIVLFLAFFAQLSFSQETNKNWSFEIGTSAVDLFPVGENTPQGDYFDEFFNLNDHYNFGAYVGVTKNFNKHLSITAKGTVNEISKYGEFGETDESVLVDNLKYYGLDGMINYSFGQGKLQPFIAVGGGYTWLEEGPYNTFSSTSNSLVGAGTVNGSIGLKYWVSNRFGINLQTTYKHVFEDYLPKHWDHNLGIVYKLNKEEQEGVVTETTTTENSRWSFEAGFSAINLFPVGENAPQGDYFDEFFNLNDHYNLGLYVGVTRMLTNNLSITAKGSVNEISKYGEFGETDESVLVDNLKYYGLDGMVNYKFGQGKLQPFIAVGGGYSWLEEGPYNTFSSTSNSLVGAGTVNGSIGAKYWFTDKIGVNLQTTYKHTFEDYLPKHWDHNLGLVYKFGKEKKEEVNNDIDGDGVPNEFDLCPEVAGLASLGGCPDADGDGVTDKDDLCPEVAGLIEFGGCPDTDGDGFPDNKDNCPKVKGTDNGCPAKVVETPTAPAEIKPASLRKVYFGFDSVELDDNAKETLDEIANSISNMQYNIAIEGHADSRGSNDYNYNLSVKRAQAIKTYLLSRNLSNDAISISGKGETQPIAPNTTASGRASNRRVELTINISAK
ncbi:thrombospondin type 3 repeat-containing protein [Lacinutrix venerupis]|uniref:OmpA family protein n=1 Tax=Lacinutrix venerupis TaxID=1486034 RepID=UPI000EB20BCE|nr:OmpA family protein [Lacinutrix venerupis]RLJ68874.1 thrombospondin type 3 repeat-containing protein [Lacinutrix venerupis]